MHHTKKNIYAYGIIKKIYIEHKKKKYVCNCEKASQLDLVIKHINLYKHVGNAFKVQLK